MADGIGIEMTTSFSSSDSSCSSYSMLTSQLDPLSEGQQFTGNEKREEGKNELTLHYNTMNTDIYGSGKTLRQA